MDSPSTGGGGGGIGQAAQELLEEMQRTQAEAQTKAPDAKPSGPNEGFENALRETNPASQVQNIEPHTKVNAAQQVLLQAKADAQLPTTKVGSVERSHMSKILEQMVGSEDKMSKLMKVAMSGKHFSQQELLGLQAGVYRFSLEMDLTGKVIERASSGIKQTMNTQV